MKTVCQVPVYNDYLFNCLQFSYYLIFIQKKQTIVNKKFFIYSNDRGILDFLYHKFNRAHNCNNKIML